MGKGIRPVGALRGVTDEGPDFPAWYEAERDRVLRSLLVVSGDADLARDAVAEAFVRAWERWDRVSAMRSPTGWVYRVALHDLRRRGRRRRAEAVLALRAARRSPGPATVPPPAVDPQLWEAVAALPRRQREAVAFRYVADLPEREVAEAMGVSEGTASATLAAARRALGARLAAPPLPDDLTAPATSAAPREATR